MDKISVIVNGITTPDFIVPCLRHIIRSTYRNREIILLGNRQTEKYFADFTEQKEGIRFIKLKTSNPAEQKNIGLEASSGGYIAYLDAKDLTGRMRFELQVPRLLEAPESGMIFCGMTLINEEGRFLKGVRLWKDYSPQYYLANMFRKHCMPSISTTLIKREVFEHIGNFDPTAKPLEEYDFWLRLAREYNVLYINLPLVRFRVLSEVEEEKHEKKVKRQILLKHPPRVVAQHLVKIFHREHDFRLALGQVLENQGRFKEALKNYQRVLEMDETNAEACFLMGNCYHEQDRYEKTRH